MTFQRSANRNFVCIKHRVAVRRPVTDRPRCAVCRSEMAMMPYRMPLPSRRSTGWDFARVVTSAVETGHPRLHVKWPGRSVGANCNRKYKK